MAKQITRDQLTALVEFAAANGRNWKDKLNTAWITGNYARFPKGSDYKGTLQGIRNEFGPSWLLRFSIKKAQQTAAANDRIFAGVYSTGISYADTTVERHGDYKRLAFLSFDTLELKIETDCPKELADRIAADAAKIQARRGEEYPISSSGQMITLGTKIVD